MIGCAFLDIHRSPGVDRNRRRGAVAAQGVRKGVPLGPAAQGHQLHRDGHGRSELPTASLLCGLPPPPDGGHLQLPHPVHLEAHTGATLHTLSLQHTLTFYRYPAHPER